MSFARQRDGLPAKCSPQRSVYHFCRLVLDFCKIMRQLKLVTDIKYLGAQGGGPLGWKIDQVPNQACQRTCSTGALARQWMPAALHPSRAPPGHICRAPILPWVLFAPPCPLALGPPQRQQVQAQNLFGPLSNAQFTSILELYTCHFGEPPATGSIKYYCLECCPDVYIKVFATLRYAFYVSRSSPPRMVTVCLA